LEIFWDSHNPRVAPSSRQYASLILYHSETQKRAAERSKLEQIASQGELQTEILPVGQFTWAEDYHQKYQLRGQRDLAAELSRVYPDYRDLTNSTAAARLNGYVGGHGTWEQLETEIGSLGLSENAQQRLQSIVSRRTR
jgi:hypothetical protein